MSESTSGRMVAARLPPLIVFASVFLVLLSSCSCDPDPASRVKKQSVPPTAPLAPVLVAERKADHVSDANKETLKSQGSDSGYGAPSNQYNQQPQQQQEYQPPPPPPSPSQAYGPQVHVTEQDYNRPADQQQQQQSYDQPQQQQQQQQSYDQQSQAYGVKGQASRPQASYSQQQQPYPSPAAPQSYNGPSAPAAPLPQSYPAAAPQPQPQQQSYAPSNYPSGQENSYNGQQSSYGSGNSAYQSAGSYSSNPAPQSSSSYGTPLESSYESPSDYASDADDEIPYDNADSGYGTSAPDQLSPINNNNYQSSGKGQGYQVASAPSYPPPQSQSQYGPPQQPAYPAAPPQQQQASSYPPPAAGYNQQQSNQAYENNGASQEPSAPSKGGYAASGSTYSTDSGSSSSPHPGGSDSRGPPPQSQSYPETSYSYGQQQQQPGSNYNMPLNYGGFRPIQLVAPPASYKSNPSKPLVVAIIQKQPSVSQQQNSYASPQGDHYNTQLPAAASSSYPDNNQYQSQQIPANSYSGPPLPLNSYASGPSSSPHSSSYQSPPAQQSSYAPSSPPSYQPAAQSSHPYPSPSAQYPAPPPSPQPQNYQPEIQQQQYPAQGPVRGYEYATEQEASDDEYQPGHPAGYPSAHPSGPGYPEYPKAAAAQPYSNAGFALDYSEGKPYGGRWLQKPYGKKFAKQKHPYAGHPEALDITIPLKYGPPPPPEEPKSPSPSYLASYASVPQVSIYPEEASPYPFGAPLQSVPLSATLPSKSYRNPSLTQSFGSYGVQNHNLRIPSASSYGTLTSDDSDLYASQLAAAASAVLPSKRKKQKAASSAVHGSDLAAGLQSDDETSYKLIPSASKLIPNIVKSPFKKIMKAFSKNKLLSWKRKSSKEAKSVTSD